MGDREILQLVHLRVEIVEEELLLELRYDHDEPAPRESLAGQVKLGRRMAGRERAV